MKKSLLLLLIFINVNVFGQKLNCNGFKMVSKIEIEKNDIKGILFQTKEYKFSYDKKKHLISVDCVVKEYMGKAQNCVSTKHIVLKQNKNELRRIDYMDNIIDKSCIYRYDLENSIIIRSGETYQPDLDGWNGDIRNKYSYNNGLLTEITKQWFGKFRNESEYEMLPERYHYIISYVNGNPYSKNKNYNREVYYDGLYDDTNVNLNAFVWDKPGHISITDEFIEICTEWIPFKSNNLLKFSGIGDNQNGIYNVIDYEYDELGNIEFVFMRNSVSDIVNRKIQITYLY